MTLQLTASWLCSCVQRRAAVRALRSDRPVVARAKISDAITGRSCQYGCSEAEPDLSSGHTPPAPRRRRHRHSPHHLQPRFVQSGASRDPSSRSIRGLVRRRCSLRAGSRNARRSAWSWCSWSMIRICRRGLFGHQRCLSGQSWHIARVKWADRKPLSETLTLTVWPPTVPAERSIPKSCLPSTPSSTLPSGTGASTSASRSASSAQIGPLPYTPDDRPADSARPSSADPTPRTPSPGHHSHQSGAARTTPSPTAMAGSTGGPSTASSSPRNPDRGRPDPRARPTTRKRILRQQPGQHRRIEHPDLSRLSCERARKGLQPTGQTPDYFRGLLGG
jgi:hypothetical protein